MGEIESVFRSLNGLMGPLPKDKVGKGDSWKTTSSWGCPAWAATSRSRSARTTRSTPSRRSRGKDFYVIKSKFAVGKAPGEKDDAAPAGDRREDQDRRRGRREDPLLPDRGPGYEVVVQPEGPGQRHDPEPGRRRGHGAEGPAQDRLRPHPREVARQHTAPSPQHPPGGAGCWFFWYKGSPPCAGRRPSSPRCARRLRTRRAPATSS
jgi:hypothetical protein